MITFCKDLILEQNFLSKRLFFSKVLSHWLKAEGLFLWHKGDEHYGFRDGDSKSFQFSAIP